MVQANIAIRVIEESNMSVADHLHVSKRILGVCALWFLRRGLGGLSRLASTSLNSIRHTCFSSGSVTQGFSNVEVGMGECMSTSPRRQAVWRNADHRVRRQRVSGAHLKPCLCQLEQLFSVAASCKVHCVVFLVHARNVDRH